MSGGLKLLIIDPQRDFCCDDVNQLPDGGPGALSVPGAWDDMNTRLPNLINKLGRKIKGISVTLDSHQEMHIAHPIFWKSPATGEHPGALTIITHDDVVNNVWTPAIPSIRSHALAYTKALAANNRYVLCTWPPHCLIGTDGATIVPGLQEALAKWARDNHQVINYVAKGSNWRTEHYSGIQADVPDPTDPGSQINMALIQNLDEAAELLIAGEASSHCLRHTVDDTRTQLGDDAAKKWTLLEDCMSGIPTPRDGAGVQIPGTPDFDTIVSTFVDDHRKLGGKVANSGDIIASFVA